MNRDEIRKLCTALMLEHEALMLRAGVDMSDPEAMLYSGGKPVRKVKDITSPARQAAEALQSLMDQLADADMAHAALVERAADGLVNAFLHMRATYAKEMAAVTPFDPLQAFYEKEVVWSAIGDAKDAIRALAPEAGVQALAELRAERDSFRAVLEGAEYGNIESIAKNDVETSRALGQVVKQLTLNCYADRDRLAAELAEARKQVEALREALRYYSDRRAYCEGCTNALDRGARARAALAAAEGAKP